MLSLNVKAALISLLAISSVTDALKVDCYEPGQTVFNTDTTHTPQTTYTTDAATNDKSLTNFEILIPWLLSTAWKLLVKTPNTLGNFVDVPDLEPDWWIPERLLNPDYPDPAKDTFYTSVPSNIAQYSLGAPIRSREVEIKNLIKEIWGISKLVDEIRQIAYHTTDTHGDPQVGIATVFKSSVKPNVPGFVPGILAQQSVVDAASHSCCQSWGLTKMSNSTGWLMFLTPEHTLGVTEALKNGHYVVITDFQGPKAGFAVGRQAGYSILDAIRATIAFHRLSPNSPVAFNGYSGGGHASLWAVNLAPSYGRGLNVTGAAYGGAPVDMQELITHLADKGFAGLGVAGLVGMANVYPKFELKIQEHLGEAGKAMMRHVRTPGVCLLSMLKHYEMGNGASIWDYFPTLGKNILQEEPIKSIVRDESLFSDNPSLTVPTFPRYYYHSEDDDIIPVGAADAYVRDQCNRGAKIWFDHPNDGEIHTKYPANKQLKKNIAEVLMKALRGELESNFECGISYPPSSRDAGQEYAYMGMEQEMMAVRNEPGYRFLFNV